MRIALTVNGRPVDADVTPRTTSPISCASICC